MNLPQLYPNNGSSVPLPTGSPTNLQSSIPVPISLVTTPLLGSLVPLVKIPTPQSTPRISTAPNTPRVLTPRDNRIPTPRSIPTSISNSVILSPVPVPSQIPQVMIPILNQNQVVTSSLPFSTSPVSSQQLPSTSVNLEPTVTTITKSSSNQDTNTVKVTTCDENTCTSTIFRLPSNLTKIPNNIDLEEANVEKKLVAKGFITIERILVHTPMGTEGRYIKAINDKGQTVFIELDGEGVVAVKDDDVILFENSSKPSIIPVSTKLGSLESVGLEATGVVFECSNGYCTMMRDAKSLEPKEIVLISSSSNSSSSNSSPSLSDEIIALTGTPVPHPIVKYTEVMANPISVNKSINSIAGRLRNNCYNNCKNELTEAMTEIEKLAEITNKYYKAQIESFEKIKSQIEWLENLQLNYCKIPPKSDNEKKRMNSIPVSLKSRFDKHIKQMILCSKVAADRREIANLTNKFKEYLADVNNDIAKLEYA